MRLLVLGVLALVGAQASAETFLGTPTIIDGGTIKIRGTAFQLEGIAAPGKEAVCGKGGDDRRCGREAWKTLMRMVRYRPVRCDTDKEESGDPKKARCFVGGRDLGAEMVARGMAVALGERYREFELYARTKSIGLWAKEGEAAWRQ